MLKKIILLCQQKGCPLELSPARYQLIHELRKRDYEIYVFFHGCILDKNIKHEIHHITNTLNLSTKDIRKKIVNISPEYIIAFTYEDARILYPLPWTMKKTNFIYFNLEIYTPSMEQYIQTKGEFFKIRCGVAYLCNKVKEIIFVKECKMFIIQDNLRKKTSAKYFVHHPNTMLIPNTYVYCEKCERKSGRKGIVYSGGLNKLQLESLFKKLDNFPNLPITFSGWSDRWFLAQYKKIHRTHPNIMFNNQTLPPEKLSEYLNQFAIGLIWYSPVKDENIYNIGLASGKLFKHLSLGQPVILVDCPGISRVIKKYKLGVVIHDISELQEAYDQIMEKYSYYQKNIFNVYKSKFDYAKVIQPFLEQLGEL